MTPVFCPDQNFIFFIFFFLDLIYPSFFFRCAFIASYVRYAGALLIYNSELLEAQPCASIKSCSWVIWCDPTWGNSHLMITHV